MTLPPSPLTGRGVRSVFGTVALKPAAKAQSERTKYPSLTFKLVSAPLPRRPTSTFLRRTWRATWRLVAGRTQVGLICGGARQRGAGRRDPGWATPGKSICREEKKGTSLLFYINHKCRRGQRHAPPSLGSIFRRPFNFLCLGDLKAQNEGF